MRADRPSHTAIKIARGMSYLGRTSPYAELLPPGAAELTERLGLAAGILRPWMIRLYGSDLFGAISRASDRRVMPGQLLGSTLRKRFVDDRVRAAIEGGASQVLVVGSGFDTLCLRLAPEHPEVTFVELDHPATMRVKRAGAERLGALPPNLRLEPADLSRVSLARALASVPWRKDVVSAVVAEGVLMYLSEPDVVAFLDAVHTLTAPGSTLVLTLIDEHAAGWLRASLSMVGERLRWGIRPDAVAGFLAEHGFTVVEGSADLATTYLAGTELADAPLPDLEHVVAAIRRAAGDEG